MDGFILTLNGVWVPEVCFMTWEAAVYGYKFSNKELIEIREHLSFDGLITTQMLSDYKKHK